MQEIIRYDAEGVDKPFSKIADLRKKIDLPENAVWVTSPEQAFSIAGLSYAIKIANSDSVAAKDGLLKGKIDGALFGGTFCGIPRVHDWTWAADKMSLMSEDRKTTYMEVVHLPIPTI